MIETKIAEFVTMKSRGVFKLSLTDAKEIVSMVAGRSVTGPHVRLFRYNAIGKGTWSLYRTIKTSQELIDQRIREALYKGPVEGYYKYECCDEAGLLQGNIFDSSPHLFD